MGRIYHLDTIDACIDPQTALLDILHSIGQDVTLHTAKESLQEFVLHPLVYGRLKDEFGEVVTWADLERYSGIDFKFQPEWNDRVFTPYRGSIPTGDLIVLRGIK